VAESRLREIEGWLKRRIQAMIDLSRVPTGGTTGQVVTKTATGYGWETPDSLLVIENRTSDPSSPTTGRLWLRTDL